VKLLVTGGVRSGKSRYAQQRAEGLDGPRTFLATAEAHDGEMQRRIERHRRERDPSWTTVEEPIEIAASIGSPGVVLLDCLTLWVSNLLMHRGDDANLDTSFRELCEAIDHAKNHVVVVTNEVGLGIVPTSPLGRRFRDDVGQLGQQVANVCDEVVLMVAGIPLRVK